MVHKKKTIRDIVPGIPEPKPLPFMQKPPIQSDVKRNVQSGQDNVQRNVQGAKVEFPSRSGGKTRISRGGEVFDLTKEEHDVFMGKAGQVTPNILGARKIEADVEREIQIKRGVEKAKLSQEIAERFKEEQLPKRMVKEQTAEQIAEAQVPEIEDIKKRVSEEDLAADIAEAKLGVSSVPEFGKAVVKGGLEIGASAVDVVMKAFSLKQSSKAQSQITQFSDATNLLTKEIELIPLGGSATNAIIALEMAAGALNRLEETEKGSGQINLRYWLDNGKELQTQIAMEKGTLDLLRAKLVKAIAAQELQGGTSNEI